LLSWIDTELERLQEVQREEGRRERGVADEPGLYRSRSREADDGLSMAGTADARGWQAEEVSAPGRVRNRGRGWSGVGDRELDMGEELAGGSWLQGKDREPLSKGLNAGERLNALARRLDHRLRQSAGEPGVRGDAEACGEDESG